MHHRELSAVFSDDLEGWGWGWGVGGRPQMERIYAYIQLIRFIVQQKLTQQSQVIMLQFF